MTDPVQITFEAGYTRLQQIAETVSRDDVPLHTLCELFAEGKGLDKALSAFLETQQARVESIEAGEALPAFQVVVPGEPTAPGGPIPATPV